MSKQAVESNGRVWWVGFAVILVVAGVLRGVNLETDEVRTDEGNYAVRAIGWNDFMFSTALGSGWLWYQRELKAPLWTQLSFNDHPPLHFATIWLSTHIFGIHLWSVRLPSVLYGIAAVTLLMLILKREGLQYGGLIAGGTLALLPWHVFISRQGIQESGVIFWILAVIALTFIADDETKTARRRNIVWFALVGLALGFGLLTKYSTAIVALPLAWIALAHQWYRRQGWWAMIVLVLLVLSPVLWYNSMLFAARGHFDLQWSRILQQDTSADWPASHQALWQGNVGQAMQFTKNQVLGLSWPVAVFAFAGAVWIGIRRLSVSRRLWVFGFVTAGLGALLALVTLNDYGRSAILLPLYFLGFGIVANAVAPIVQRLAIVAVFGFLALTNIPAIGRGLPVTNLVATFWENPAGFQQWEQWQRINVSATLRPRHYQSLAAWLFRQMDDTLAATDRLFVYDNRFSWFPANWYFYRYGFYATDAVFMNAGIFAYLNQQNALQNWRGRTLRYVQVGPAGRDSKTTLDVQTQATEDFFRTLVTQQQSAPEIIFANDGRELARVWTVQWTPDVSFPDFPVRP